MGEVVDMSSESIRADIDELMMACDEIEDANRCIECPLKYNCLREESIEDIWSNVSVSRIEDFLDFADNLYEIEPTNEDMIAFNADMSRQDDYVYGEE